MFIFWANVVQGRKKKKSNAVLFKSDHFKYKQKKLLLEICQKSFSLFVKLLFRFPLTRAE